jgi:hypothetical protein
LPLARLQARVERAHAGAERFYRPLGVLRLAQAALERLLARLLLGVERVVLGVQGGLVCRARRSGRAAGRPRPRVACAGCACACAISCWSRSACWRACSRSVRWRRAVMVGAFQFAQLPSELLDFGFRALHFGREGFGVGVYLLPLALQGVQNGGARPLLGVQVVCLFLQSLGEFGEGAFTLT